MGVCLGGGGERSLTQHPYTHTYILLHTGCLCVSRGEWVHIMTPKSGWKVRHCPMFEGIVSHVCTYTQIVLFMCVGGGGGGSLM